MCIDRAAERVRGVHHQCGNGMHDGEQQRRRFLQSAAAALATAAMAPGVRAFDLAEPKQATTPAPAIPEQPVRCVQPFALNQVKLLDSDFARATAINLRYLQSLPVDRL